MTLSVGEVREHVESSLSDDAVQRLLDAAYATIEARIGPLGVRTELANGGSRSIYLGRPADSISSASETIGTTVTALAADDYRIRPDRYGIERLSTGTNQRSRWWGEVSVTYIPVDDEPIRDMVAIDLCKLALNYTPGETMEQIGSWTVQYAANALWNNTAEREMVLARLDPSPGLVVVGSSHWSAW